MPRKKTASEVEHRLLALLKDRGDMSGRDLARMYRENCERPISPGTLYVTLSRLRDRGWIEVEDAHDKDGRIRFFRVTPEGRHALEEARQICRSLLALS